MCLAIPAQIISLHDENMATVEVGGVQREVSLALVDAEVGRYVIVHVGIAISTLDEAEALKTLEMIAALESSQSNNS